MQISKRVHTSQLTWTTEKAEVVLKHIEQWYMCQNASALGTPRLSENDYFTFTFYINDRRKHVCCSCSNLLWWLMVWFFFFRKSLFLFCGCLTDTNFQISTSLMAAQFPAVTVLNRVKNLKKSSARQKDWTADFTVVLWEGWKCISLFSKTGWSHFHQHQRAQLPAVTAWKEWHFSSKEWVHRQKGEIVDYPT